MKLTRFQRQYLNRLIAVYQSNGAIWSVFFWPLVRGAVLLAALLGIIYGATALLADDPMWPLAIFCAGMFYGICVRNFGGMRASAKLWPIHSKIIDWDQVAHLLEANRPPVHDDLGTPSRPMPD